MTIMDNASTAIVVNRQAGTVRSMGEEAVRALVIEAYGEEVDLAFLDGDGSVAGAAEILAGTQVALGILPLGTMNLMAQTIGLDLDLAVALAQLHAAEVKPVDAARANGRVPLPRR